MTNEDKLGTLIESLRLIAAPPEQQRAAIPAFASVTDEVATTFGDAYLLVPQLVRAGLITDLAAISLARLDEWLEGMPADGSVADTGSLETHEFWAIARRLGLNALDSMGAKVKPPKLAHIRWMDG